MAVAYYGAIARVGGTDGAMDKLATAKLNDGDQCFVIESGICYTYTLDEDNAGSEDTTYYKIVTPDDVGTSDKRWTLNSWSTEVPREWSGQQNFNELDISEAAQAAPAWDLDLAQCAVIDLDTNDVNVTFADPTNKNAGATYVLRIIQGTNLRTIAFNAAFIWGEAAAPSAPAADNDVLILSFYSDGTKMYGAEYVREEA